MCASVKSCSHRKNCLPLNPMLAQEFSSFTFRQQRPTGVFGSGKKQSYVITRKQGNPIYMYNNNVQIQLNHDYVVDVLVKKSALSKRCGCIHCV